MHLAFHFLDLFLLYTDLDSSVVHLRYEEISLRSSFDCVEIFQLCCLVLDVRIVTSLRVQLHFEVLVLLPVRADVTTIAHYVPK